MLKTHKYSWKLTSAPCLPTFNYLLNLELLMIEYLHYGIGVEAVSQFAKLLESFPCLFTTAMNQWANFWMELNPLMITSEIHTICRRICQYFLDSMDSTILMLLDTILELSSHIVNHCWDSQHIFNNLAWSAMENLSQPKELDSLIMPRLELLFLESQALMVSIVFINWCTKEESCNQNLLDLHNHKLQSKLKDIQFQVTMNWCQTSLHNQMHLHSEKH